jgi:hypothetical protein
MLGLQSGTLVALAVMGLCLVLVLVLLLAK